MSDGRIWESFGREGLFVSWANDPGDFVYEIDVNGKRGHCYSTKFSLGSNTGTGDVRVGSRMCLSCPCLVNLYNGILKCNSRSMANSDLVRGIEGYQPYRDNTLVKYPSLISNDSYVKLKSASGINCEATKYIRLGEHAVINVGSMICKACPCFKGNIGGYYVCKSCEMIEIHGGNSL